MIRDIYRGLLEREPESDAVVSAFASRGLSLDQLLREFTASPEFRARAARWRRKHGLIHAGVTRDDEAAMRRYLVRNEPEERYVKTFIGVRQRADLVGTTRELGGAVFNDVPTFIGDPNAEPIEYVGVIRAVEAGRGPFVCLELGAGIGTWSVNAGHLARRNGRAPIRLHAAEASDGKVANLRQHFADNGFPPEHHRVHRAAVGPADGTASFPRTDPVDDWGGEARFGTDAPRRGGDEQVPCLTVDTLLTGETAVDLVHMDIQGAEGDVVAASIEVLTRKVRYLVIGTHSREVETRLISALQGAGWILEREQTARIDRSGAAAVLRIDGTQVWRNPSVA